MTKISCIIPTYNEESRIANVLNVISMHPAIDEVIVVDDGSKDNTRDIVARFSNVRLIIHEKNQGKSRAIYTGIKASHGEFLLFIDADLVGLNAQNVSNLTEPILNKNVDVTISLRNYKFWRLIGIDPLSGERVLPRILIENRLNEIGLLSPFGLEVFLNRLIIKHSKRIKIVLWKNVISPSKSRKFGLLIGIKSDIDMLKDIFKIISPKEALLQIIHLTRQKIK